MRSARPGQVVVELGSYPVPVKKRQVAPLAEKGAAFIDGEVAGTPGMVLARKGVIYLAGDAGACKKVEPVVAAFADSCIYFGPFGAASRVKLINNLLVSIHIAATAEAMALGFKAGVDKDLLIKAIASGSGGSTQFGIRAPWMAERVQAAARPDPGLAALHRDDRRDCRRRRRGDAAARSHCRIVRALCRDGTVRLRRRRHDRRHQFAAARKIERFGPEGAETDQKESRNDPSS